MNSQPRIPYLSDSRAAVVEGDCIELMKQIPDKSIDFVFSDPPYHLSNGGITVKSGRMASVDKGNWDTSGGLGVDLEFHRRWLSEVRRVLTDDGSIAVSGSYHSIYRCGFLLEELGFRILNDIVWHKPNGAPNLTRRNFAASHETVLWAARSRQSKQVFNYETMRSWDESRDRLKNPGKQMRSVWSIATTPRSEKQFGWHPTQKPLELLRRFIAACTEPGSVVMDPFCGSGTTGVAAVEAGRPFIGFEIDHDYAALARARLLHTASVRG